MIWSICFCLSVVAVAASCAYALATFRRYKSDRFFSPFNAVFAGVFLAVYIGMVPVWADILNGESPFLLLLLLMDTVQSIQVFTVNVGGDFILDNISQAGDAFRNVYAGYMSCLFVLAPLLTFGFLASLFKNAMATLSYRLHFRSDVYVFSELNEKSVLLAQSIYQNHKRAHIVFNNVSRDEGGVSDELLESAKELNALTFQKDILSVDYAFHSTRSSINFFVIGRQEGENLMQALKLLSLYGNRDKTRLYVFSTGAEGELLLSNAPKGKIKLRRIHDVRSLVYRYLYEDGHEIFESALPGAEGDKEIHAVVLGLGKAGTEMLKALSWYCQMDGYALTVDAYDRNELAREQFYALCPELMSETYNGVRIPGETQYTIRVHSGVDVTTHTFAQSLAAIPAPTYVFICLGDDADNINCAANVRMLCQRRGAKPVIRTIVYSDAESQALEGVCNYRKQPYGILPLGALAHAFSEETLLESRLEQLALQRHLKWGNEEEFWQYEYNYCSSMASAIHMQARIACGIPGAHKAESQLSPEEQDIIEKLEHRRWNAYMRSAGYVYSGSTDKSTRDDLAKMHHDLVDFDRLSEEDKRKDSSVGTL